MLITLFFLVFIFLISVFFSKLYVSGDQYLYNDVYQYMQDKSIFESYLYYSAIISKLEFIHFLLSYIGSSLGFDKSIYMSFFNVCLFYTGLNFLRKCGFPLVLSIVILLSNFYIFTLMFSLERLKFAIIFLFIFLSYDNFQIKNKATFAILSILSHVQLIIFYVVLFIERLSLELKKIFFRLKVSKAYFFIIPVSFIVIYTLSNPIFNKVLFYIDYYGDNTFFGFIKWLVFYVLVFLSTKRKKKISVIFFALFIPVLIIGAERILFYCLILFFMEYRYRTKLYFLFLCSFIIYYMVKSTIFLNNIYFNGTGY